MAPRGRRKVNDSSASHVPEVYRELLAEAGFSPARNDEDGRSVKRRRVGGRIVKTGEVSDEENIVKDEPVELKPDSDTEFEDVLPVRQSIEQSEPDDSEGSNFDWEDVDLKANSDRGSVEADDGMATRDQGLNLVLDAKKVLERPKRKVVPAIEKKLRLEVHKMNICCLMIHAHIRNHWCNDDIVQVSGSACHFRLC